MNNMNDVKHDQQKYKVSEGMGIFRFLVYSAAGVFATFISVEIGGNDTIILQHLINLVYKVFGDYIPYYTLAMIVFGGVYPFLKGTWNNSRQEMVFTFLKILGVGIGAMAVFNIGPAFLMDENMIPFLFNLIVEPISVMIPIAVVSFVLLINYGILEFFSVLLKPLMRKIWKTPGESALDAILSFADGYAFAVLVTNKLYKKGIYSLKEAVIIATGFSTVSITFLVVIANTLGLMDYWNLFVLTTFVVTFTVTAITARIYPISKMPQSYYDKPIQEREEETGNILFRAFKSGINAARNSNSLYANAKEYFLGDALKMSSAVTASIMSIGLIGLLISGYTPFFDYLGYIFYPVVALMKLPDPMLSAKANASEIAEMFIPSLLVIQSDMITKFVTAVTSISGILFFSASIPCLMSTDIPVKMRDILLIWVERTMLSIVFASIIAHLVF
ncbi:nucleoside recognition GATE domain-containing membrane protein YjiH [Dethiosulfatibacter aminovorans DSM 17477]|uniref:Nucleoside recognition GATE domain-containing membrane protein YjiH n=1 Tax=Dethiosulfatibacter aminovorans DSM 17477 TaxID=1121476 RepID=A0A1M6MQG8_9FIRM|nr:YjiH family protein [Dethiosulfatibacter aminovorans]SHJ85646.1 nucleoside recognition GATE domain-containing membrane protein YjiH [Dethiosulfatibacter aminovorans DSM 17477]